MKRCYFTSGNYCFKFLCRLVYLFASLWYTEREEAVQSRRPQCPSAASCSGPVTSTHALYQHQEITTEKAHKPYAKRERERQVLRSVVAQDGEAFFLWVSSSPPSSVPLIQFLPPLTPFQTFSHVPSSPSNDAFISRLRCLTVPP